MKRKLRFRVLAVCLIVGSYHALAATHYVSLASPAPRTPYASWSTAHQHSRCCLMWRRPRRGLCAAGVYAQGACDAEIQHKHKLGESCRHRLPYQCHKHRGPGRDRDWGAGHVRIGLFVASTSRIVFWSGFTLSKRLHTRCWRWIRLQRRRRAQPRRVVSNCVIINCAAYYTRGAAGVAVADMRLCAVLHNCTFINNSARYGGGGASWCDLHAVRVSATNRIVGRGLNEVRACNTLVVSTRLCLAVALLERTTNCTVVCNDALEAAARIGITLVNSIVKGKPRDASHRLPRVRLCLFMLDTTAGWAGAATSTQTPIGERSQ